MLPSLALGKGKMTVRWIISHIILYELEFPVRQPTMLRLREAFFFSVLFC